MVQAIIQTMVKDSMESYKAILMQFQWHLDEILIYSVDIEEMWITY